MKKTVVYTTAVVASGTSTARLKTAGIFVMAAAAATIGCSTPPAQYSPSVRIDLGPAEAIQYADYGDYLDHADRATLSHSIPVEVLVPEDHWFTCGLSYGLAQPDLSWLNEISTLYTFSGTTETWIPINGKPQQYYIFKLR